MKWLINFCLLLVLVMSLGACGTADENDGAPADTGNTGEGGDGDTAEVDRDITITFGVTNWTSTIPPTYIAKEILEDQGYTVELQSADPGAVFTGLSRGDIDVFMDAWLPDMHADYMERFGDDIDDVATSYPDGELGWVIPDYVDEIDSLEDIRGNEDLFEGKMYGIEEGGGMTITSREIIDELGLELEYVASSEAGMLTEARRHMTSEDPVLFLGWRPHPMFVDYDLKVLEGQEEYFPTSEVHVLVNIDFEEKAPEAYDFFSNWSIDIGDIEEMIIQIEDGADKEEVARQWIEDNEEHVQEMIGNNT